MMLIFDNEIEPVVVQRLHPSRHSHAPQQVMGIALIRQGTMLLWAFVSHTQAHATQTWARHKRGKPDRQQTLMKHL